MALNNVMMLGHLKFLILYLTAKIEQHLHYELRAGSHGSQVLTTGRSLHCEVENHVRTKFATPMKYAIDIFSLYT